MDIDKIALEVADECELYITPLNRDASAKELGFFIESMLDRMEQFGWKLVPTKPTDKMIASGAWHEYYEESSNRLMVDDEDVISVWESMLSSAPSWKR